MVHSMWHEACGSFYFEYVLVKHKYDKPATLGCNCCVLCRLYTLHVTHTIYIIHTVYVCVDYMYIIVCTIHYSIQYTLYLNTQYALYSYTLYYGIHYNVYCLVCTPLYSPVYVPIVTRRRAQPTFIDCVLVFPALF